MRDTKPFASLSSGLLARKGAAKPAMRPQGFGSFGGSLEDLGWNDMGQQEAATPATEPLAGNAGLTPSTVRNAPEPAVIVHQRALEQTFAQEAPVEEVQIPPKASVAKAEVVNLPQRPRATRKLSPSRPTKTTLPAKAKAAFTLRLDPERHLRLRLACAVSHRSAQQLVTGALDEFLKSLPEIEALAERLPIEASGR
ncbi:hypothetical protein [Allosphingosinicella deserti]|uniref:Uncharacterized protein n=1 Tax=Allosphingosinicella deserti TaxID=2116704 RepID=A0A2P7QHK3_9SPHN|nr:hypothetical protein [Sphingomonas deserti]PSJ37433.1 hypothetical protein C7I55_22425 [Sphingomonas deserti]